MTRVTMDLDAVCVESAPEPSAVPRQPVTFAKTMKDMYVDRKTICAESATDLFAEQLEMNEWLVPGTDCKVFADLEESICVSDDVCEVPPEYIARFEGMASEFNERVMMPVLRKFAQIPDEVDVPMRIATCHRMLMEATNIVDEDGNETGEVRWDRYAKLSAHCTWTSVYLPYEDTKVLRGELIKHYQGLTNSDISHLDHYHLDMSVYGHGGFGTKFRAVNQIKGRSKNPMPPKDICAVIT
jgi:hypothetical protein